MFLREIGSLQDLLIEVLSQRPNVAATLLSEESRKRYKKVSIQAIYKELRKLQARGTVIKAGRQYTLSLTWVLKMIQLADELERTYLKGRGAPIPIPPANQSISWHFSDLRRTDDFWINALIALLEHTGEQRVFQWVPHPWFHLAQHERELTFQETLRALKRRIFMNIGGNSFLDQAFSKFWPADVYSTSYVESPFAERPYDYLNIIGDFTLRITLDAHTTAEIESIFARVKSKRELAEINVATLLNQKASITIRLYHDAVRARRLRGSFRRAFPDEVRESGKRRN